MFTLQLFYPCFPKSKNLPPKTTMPQRENGGIRKSFKAVVKEWPEELPEAICCFEKSVPLFTFL